jgi:hypothetical protein
MSLFFVDLLGPPSHSYCVASFLKALSAMETKKERIHSWFQNVLHS